MKSILVPIDFSILSKHVLEYAAVISKRLKAPLVLLHTHNFKASSLVEHQTERYQKEIQEFIEQKDLKLIEQCNQLSQSTGMPCSYLLYKGVPAEFIVSTAEELKPDLLIMGSESLSSFERFLFDATSPKVFKKAKGKLLIVPENAGYTSFQNIGFATNFYDGDFENIDYLLQLAEENSSTLHLVHVIDQDIYPKLERQDIEDYTRKLEKTYPDTSLKIHLLEGNHVAKEILRFTLNENIDLLAVAKTDKSPLEAFFSKSVTKKLFLKTKVPLLVLRVDESLNDFF